MSTGSKPQRIEPEFYSKVWGSPRIGPWFEMRGDEPTGEAWFPGGDLLIKFLFTSQRLSVQVHPDDAYARVHENSRGKTEMWHILRADPGAAVALGFQRTISPAELASSAQTGEIMNLLNWIEVQPGDTYFVPPGTVHAIGAGIALCEIQQNSDITYRLFDYNRGRPLHLVEASQVSDLGPHPGKCVTRDLGDGLLLLAECRYFRTYEAIVNQPRMFDESLGIRFLIVIEGAGRVNELAVSAGQVLSAPSSCDWLIEPGKSAPAVALKLLLTG